MQTSTGPGRTKADMNVTPMIDVLLVLIIIFLVIAPIQSRGLPALVPQNPAPDRVERRERHDIVISIHADGALFLNQEAIGLAGLKERLRQLFQNAPADVIFVRGDRQTKFRRVAEVIDVARGAGVHSIGLMTN